MNFNNFKDIANKKSAKECDCNCKTVGKNKSQSKTLLKRMGEIEYEDDTETDIGNNTQIDCTCHESSDDETPDHQKAQRLHKKYYICSISLCIIK